MTAEDADHRRVKGNRLLPSADELAGLGRTPVGMARSAPAEFPGEFCEVNSPTAGRRTSR